MEEEQTLTTETEVENERIEFEPNKDVCQQLMDRYANSAAPQHRHLVATAAAMRSILTSESLPLTPPAYFAAAISSLESATLDSTEVSALLTFLSIVVAVVPCKGIAELKASEAAGVLVGLVDREDRLAVASVRCAVKCLGALLAGFCDLDNWGLVQLGFETLLKFSVDKRPKVRRCAQDCLEKVLKSFQSSTVTNSASKLLNSLFRKYIPLAATLSASRTLDASKDETLSKNEQLEVLHMLNVVKLTVPYLNAKVGSKLLSELCKLMSSEISPLTRHIFKCMEAFFESSKFEVDIGQTENVIASLAAYVSLKEKNPLDTIMDAAVLLKGALVKLRNGDVRSSWVKNVPVVFGALAGLLASEARTAYQASCILKEMIGQLDLKTFLVDENPSLEDASFESEEAGAIKSTCAIFEKALSSCDGIPDEHILAVISLLFLELGEISHIFMKSIVHKLAENMTLANVDMSSMNNLQHCIGSAVVAMGPERILTLLPISLNADDFTFSNIWLVPILKSHVFEASLGFYMEHIVPLAKSFQRASRKVKKSVIGQDLQAHAQGLWGLLPAFCRYPIDTRRKFGSLAKLLITLLKNDSSMHEHIAIALQVLVNQNRGVLASKAEFDESSINEANDSILQIRRAPSYTRKIATKNIRALSSFSANLLQSMIDVFIDSQREKCSYLKDAVGCLATITDSFVTKNIFISLLKRFQLVNDGGKFENMGTPSNDLVEKEESNQSVSERYLQRSVIMELAASLVEGANKDLVDLIYNFIRNTFQATDEIGHLEAYHTLGKILKEHAWFCTSRYEELIELLLGLKSPADVASLRQRFACFHFLLVHTLKGSMEEENTKAFLILNEIIITLKDAIEERRKAAYDVLLSISSSLRDSSHANSDALYQQLISMIMGYLSGSSPHIKSGAVSALSVLVYKDPDICLSMPDLVSSLLSLLHSKALEVIKAVLGFVKVMVSCLQAKEMQNLLADVVTEVLPWSSVSRNHFRSKVTVILEIMIRKCGFAAVELVTPEKYRRFVKTVLENRQNKSGSKESEAVPETVTVDSPTKGSHKRKHKEKDTRPKENHSTEHRKRKRDKQQNFGLSEPRMSTGPGGLKSAKRARNFEKPMKGPSKGSGKFKNSFNKGQQVVERQRWRENKEKDGEKTKGRKGETVVRRPASGSKFSKNKKFGGND